MSVAPVHAKHKLAPQWVGPFQVLWVPHYFQVIYIYGGSRKLYNSMGRAIVWAPGGPPVT